MSTINGYNIVVLGYLKGYVYESSVVSSLFDCQIKCDILHVTCKSLNYVENEDGSNICEINYDAQICTLPRDFIVKDNSFYVETMPEKDLDVSISALLLWFLISLLFEYKAYNYLLILHMI